MAGLEDLGLGAASGISVDKTLSTGLLILEIAIITILVVVAILVVMSILRFNVKVVMEEVHEHGILVLMKRARIGFDRTDKAQNVEKIWIRGEKHGHPIMPPTHVISELKKITEENGEEFTSKSIQGWYKSMYALTKRGKKMLRIVKTGTDYTVIPWTNNDILPWLTISKADRKQWAKNMRREMYEKYKPEPGFLEKYGHYVALAGAFVVIIVIFLVLFNKFDLLADYSGAINNYAQNLGEFTQAIRDANIQPVQ